MKDDDVFRFEKNKESQVDPDAIKGNDYSVIIEVKLDTLHTLMNIVENALHPRVEFTENIEVMRNSAKETSQKCLHEAQDVIRKLLPTNL